MYNLIISSVANSVSYDGLSLTGLSLPIPSGIKSLYWDTSASKGWIENLDSNGNYIGNTDITALPTWANQSVTLYQNTITTAEQTAAEAKKAALNTSGS